MIINLILIKTSASVGVLIAGVFFSRGCNEPD